MVNKKITMLEILHYLKDEIVFDVKYNDMIYKYDESRESYKTEDSNYLIEDFSVLCDKNFINIEFEIIRCNLLNREEKQLLKKLCKNNAKKVTNVIVKRSKYNYIALISEKEVVSIEYIKKGEFKNLKTDKLYDLDIIL